MKPASFRYFRPDTLDEALALMAEHAGDAKPLAGGQSLVPAMNFRIAQPAVLVDLNRVTALASVARSGDGGLRVGGMTRHRMLEHSPVVREAAPLVAEAMPFVAHPPIRTRGTIGGSLAHADPAAELPAVMLAIGASLVLRSRTGTRTLAAADFFLGLYATALEPDELVTEIVVPPQASRTGWAIDEVARRHGDYALAGVAAEITLDSSGSVASARIALFSVHDRSVLATKAAGALVGAKPSDEAIRAAARAAARHDAEPSPDIHASAEYRRHLVEILTRRVVRRAADRARYGAGASRT